MKIDTDDIIKLINQEIRLHENYEETRAVSEGFYSGFIDGLKQAIYLIGQVEGITMDESETLRISRAMTPDDFASKMDAIWMSERSHEQMHVKANQIVYDLLKQLGYHDGAYLFETISDENLPLDEDIYNEAYMEAMARKKKS